MNDHTSINPTAEPGTHVQPASPRLAQAIVEQRRRWQEGDRVPVETFLEQAPTLWDEPAAVLDLIYSEKALREKLGEAPQLEEYVQRFPQLASQLTLQFHTDRVVPALHPAARTGFRASPRGGGFTGPLAGPAPAVAGYEILGELGRGGMGVVYKARQLALDRVVALKMILAGITADRRSLEQFRTEAAAAARLQHPNIVQVYETGEQDGRPYFSLEYVEGGNLAQRMTARPQPPEEAAALVETLARAVDVMHQRGILHRDLKPGNILLTPDGTPKITDFGVAKLLDEDAHRTQTGVPIGTANYMAPEQAAGRSHDIGPPVDIYALGAMLYELLTGRPPFNGATALETLQQVQTTEPVSPRRLQPRCPRDLETICCKCLQKEPARRYASAAYLADDLRRFLDGKPILARPTSTGERVWKWCRRHPAGAGLIGLSTLTALGLIIGLAVYDAKISAYSAQAETQRNEARQNFRQALNTLDQLVAEVTRMQADAPQMEAQRRQISDRILKFYQQFVNNRAGDPLEAAQAYSRLGDIQDLHGNLEEAEDSYRQALSLLKQQIEDSPLVIARREMARTEAHLGVTLKKAGKYTEAERELENAIRLDEQLAADAPNDPGILDELADAHYQLGAVLARNSEKYADAKRQYEEVLAIQKRLADGYPGRAQYRRALARTLNNYGILLTKMEPDRKKVSPKARTSIEKALAIQETLRQQNPGEPVFRHELARSYSNFATLLERSSNLSGAEQHYRGAVTLLSQLAADYPMVPEYAKDLGNAYTKLGVLLRSAHDLRSAANAYQQAVAVQTKLVKEYPNDRAYQKDLATGSYDLAQVLYDLGQVTSNPQGAVLVIQSTFNPACFWSVALSYHIDLLPCVPLLQRAVELDGTWSEGMAPGTAPNDLLLKDSWLLAKVLLDLGDYRGAAAAAEKLPGLSRASRTEEPFEEDLRAAQFLVRCMNLAAADPRNSEDQRKKLLDQYADRVMALLRDAVDRGFRNPRRLRALSIYKALRGREDFQKLYRALEEKAKTAGLPSVPTFAFLWCWSTAILPAGRA